MEISSLGQTFALYSSLRETFSYSMYVSLWGRKRDSVKPAQKDMKKFIFVLSASSGNFLIYLGSFK